MALLFFWKKKSLFNLLQTLLKEFEGFSSKPYWDVSRWSWGYGTQVPNSIDNPTIKPNVSISKSNAMNDAMNFSMQQQQVLRNYLHKPLKDNQWAAVLSFAYNLGTGNGTKLINVINSSDLNTIKNYWLQFVNVKGVPNDDLLARRKKEFSIYSS